MLYEYDATNEVCPLPLVKMRVMLKKLQSGDVYILRVADTGSKTDIPKLLSQQGYHFYQQDLAQGIVEIKIVLA
ncbi:sulfurtransferase TusA family protein [Thalassotalea sp. PLHSN55]|uniref:sulfurtransferase TusA family protein n=1 Tax=Thalassotalea sp. PLHSN55 TaxID=3435888 RepID=UPI003F85A585